LLLQSNSLLNNRPGSSFKLKEGVSNISDVSSLKKPYTNLFTDQDQSDFLLLSKQNALNSNPKDEVSDLERLINLHNSSASVQIEIASASSFLNPPPHEESPEGKDFEQHVNVQDVLDLQQESLHGQEKENDKENEGTLQISFSQFNEFDPQNNNEFFVNGANDTDSFTDFLQIPSQQIQEGRKSASFEIDQSDQVKHSFGDLSGIDMEKQQNSEHSVFPEETDKSKFSLLFTPSDSVDKSDKIVVEMMTKINPSSKKDLHNDSGIPFESLFSDISQEQSKKHEKTANSDAIRIFDKEDDEELFGNVSLQLSPIHKEEEEEEKAQKFTFANEQECMKKQKKAKTQKILANIDSETKVLRKNEALNRSINVLHKKEGESSFKGKLSKTLTSALEGMSKKSLPKRSDSAQQTQQALQLPQQKSPRMNINNRQQSPVNKKNLNILKKEMKRNERDSLLNKQLLNSEIYSNTSQQESFDDSLLKHLEKWEFQDKDSEHSRIKSPLFYRNDFSPSEEIGPSFSPQFKPPFRPMQRDTLPPSINSQKKNNFLIQPSQPYAKDSPNIPTHSKSPLSHKINKNNKIPQINQMKGFVSRKPKLKEGNSCKEIFTKVSAASPNNALNLSLEAKHTPSSGNASRARSLIHASSPSFKPTKPESKNNIFESQRSGIVLTNSNSLAKQSKFPSTQKDNQLIIKNTPPKKPNYPGVPSEMQGGKPHVPHVRKISKGKKKPNQEMKKVYKPIIKNPDFVNRTFCDVSMDNSFTGIKNYNDSNIQNTSMEVSGTKKTMSHQNKLFQNVKKPIRLQNTEIAFGKPIKVKLVNNAPMPAPQEIKTTSDGVIKSSFKKETSPTELAHNLPVKAIRPSNEMIPNISSNLISSSEFSDFVCERVSAPKNYKNDIFISRPAFGNKSHDKKKTRFGEEEKNLLSELEKKSRESQLGKVNSLPNMWKNEKAAQEHKRTFVKNDSFTIKPKPSLDISTNKSFSEFTFFIPETDKSQKSFWTPNKMFNPPNFEYEKETKLLNGKNLFEPLQRNHQNQKRKIKPPKMGKKSIFSINSHGNSNKNYENEESNSEEKEELEYDSPFAKKEKILLQTPQFKRQEKRITETAHDQQCWQTKPKDEQTKLALQIAERERLNANPEPSEQRPSTHQHKKPSSPPYANKRQAFSLDRKQKIKHNNNKHSEYTAYHSHPHVIPKSNNQTHTRETNDPKPHSHNPISFASSPQKDFVHYTNTAHTHDRQPPASAPLQIQHSPSKGYSYNDSNPDNTIITPSSSVTPASLSSAANSHLKALINIKSTPPNPSTNKDTAPSTASTNASSAKKVFKLTNTPIKVIKKMRPSTNVKSLQSSQRNQDLSFEANRPLFKRRVKNARILNQNHNLVSYGPADSQSNQSANISVSESVSQSFVSQSNESDMSNSNINPGGNITSLKMTNANKNNVSNSSTSHSRGKFRSENIMIKGNNIQISNNTKTVKRIKIKTNHERSPPTTSPSTHFFRKNRFKDFHKNKNPETPQMFSLSPVANNSNNSQKNEDYEN
jgi:hypothetical protein